VAKRDDFYRYHDAEQNLCIDLNKDDAHLAISDKERLQEDLRLLYVAMTRAQHACWLGLAPVKKGLTKSCQLEKSAMGYLLGWQPNTEAGQLANYLQALSEQAAEIEIVPLPTANDEVYQPHDQQTQFDAPEQARLKVADNWWIASYSSLNLSEKTVIAPTIEEPELPQDSTFSDESEDETLSPVLVLPQIGVQHLPRGSGPGILVHGLLEQCGRAGFAYSANNAEQRQEWIENQFKSAIWNDKQPIINAALQHWLTMPAFDDGFCLADLQAGQYQVEMEFLLGVDEVDGVDVQLLDQAVSEAIFAKQSRPSLLAKKVSGLLKGFIDLVFVHNGQYYVTDYKFNYLGDSLADYDLPQLTSAMLDKRYDLQLVLYVLALHRLLKTRLPEYDYQTHVGGGLYLFLRGAENSAQGRVLLKPDFQLIDYLDRLFKGDAE
jgi:exodeoxyribonuclease V beta subunit